MNTLSKSKLIAFRQCPKRLWLEVHRPDLRADSSATQASFSVGHTVGRVARSLYDPEGQGCELNREELGMDGLLTKTQELLSKRKPLFEAGFVSEEGGRALALADVLLPVGTVRSRQRRMVEVKSSTSVADYHRDDVAIQHFVATQSGLKLSGVALAYVDRGWTYPGGENYQGLLVEEDLTAEAASRSGEVEGWISNAHQVVARKKPPKIEMGPQCSAPFECGFFEHCTQEHEQVQGVTEYPVQWLPRVQTQALKNYIQVQKVRSMAEVPNELLNAVQLRVKRQTLANRVYFDASSAARDLAAFKLPALFLDFETISFAVPIWAGTRPYQQIPFQFSLHRVLRTGRTEHTGFLDVSGRDPGSAFVKALLAACEGSAPIFVYGKGFEGGRIRELAMRFPRFARQLMAIEARLVDLLPIAANYFYHPVQEGSWSIKAVLPAIAPELDYAHLEGVQDGGGAQAAFMEAVASETTADRRRTLVAQLWRYCRLDTFAMVRLWAHFSGRQDLVKPVDDALSAGAPV